MLFIKQKKSTIVDVSKKSTIVDEYFNRVGVNLGNLTKLEKG